MWPLATVPLAQPPCEQQAATCEQSMRLTYVGFVICQWFLKISFIVFTVFATYFHVCNLGTTEDDDRSKEKTQFSCVNVM